MNPNTCRRFAAFAGALLLAGCAAWQRPPEPVHYRCDGDSEFAITFLPGDAGAQIEFRGMRFPLRRETAASGLRYTCDVMVFTAEGERAQVEIQDLPDFQNCRMVKR